MCTSAFLLLSSLLFEPISSSSSSANAWGEKETECHPPTIRPHEHYEFLIDLNPRGDIAVSCQNSSQVVAWRTSDKHMLLNFSESCNDARWTPDGRYIAVHQDKLSVVVHDFPSGRWISTFSPCEWSAWNSNTTKIFCMTSLARGHIWDFKPGYWTPENASVTSDAPLNLSTSPPVWSPDGKSIAYIACVNFVLVGSKVTVLSSSDLNVTNSYAPGGHTSVYWSPDSKAIISAGFRGVFIFTLFNPNNLSPLVVTNEPSNYALWDRDVIVFATFGAIKFWQQISTNTTDSSLPYSFVEMYQFQDTSGETTILLTWSLDHFVLASTSRRGETRVWRGLNFAIPGYVFQGIVNQFSWLPSAPNEPLILAILTVRQTVIMDWNQRTVLHRIPAHSKSELVAIRYSPDGKMLVFGYGDGTIVVTETTTYTVIQNWTEHATPLTQFQTAVEWSPDGRIFSAVTDAIDNILHPPHVPVLVWDPVTGKKVGNISAQMNYGVLAFSRDGKRVVVAGDRVEVWDAHSFTLLSKLWDQDPLLSAAAAFNPNGTLLAIGGEGGISLWNATDGSGYAHLQDRKDCYVNNIVWSDDGELLAGSCLSGAFLWHLSTNTSQLVTLGAGFLQWVPHSGLKLALAVEAGITQWQPFSMFSSATLSSSIASHPSKLTLSAVGIDLSQVLGISMNWLDAATLDYHCYFTTNFTSAINSLNNDSTANMTLSADVLLTSPGPYDIYAFDPRAPNGWAFGRSIYVTCPPAADVDTSVRPSQCKCHTGFYSTELPAIHCLPCPTHAQCPGGMDIVATNGFWKLPDPTQPGHFIFLDCAAAACNRKYEVNGSILTNCAPGYSGPICGECITGYGQYGYGSCQKCPSPALSGFWFFVGILTFGVVIALQSIFALRQGGIGVNVADKATKRYEGDSAQLVMLIVSTTQVNTMLLRANVELASGLRTLFIIPGAAQGAIFEYSSFACVLLANGWSPSSVQVVKLVFLLMLPPCCFLILSSIRAILKLSTGIETASEIAVVPTVIAWSTLQTTIGTALFQMMSCRSVDFYHLDYRLMVDISAHCYDRKHYMAIGILVIPGFLLYVIGAPIAIVAALRMCRRKSARYLQFMVRNFTTPYWVLVLSIRRLLLAAVVSFAREAYMQLVLIGFILLVSQLIAVLVRPSMSSKVNFVDGLSLGTSSFIFLASVALLGDNGAEDPRTKTILISVLVVLVTVGVYFIMVAILLNDLKERVQADGKQNINKLRVWCRTYLCCCCNDQWRVFAMEEPDSNVELVRDDSMLGRNSSSRYDDNISDLDNDNDNDNDDSRRMHHDFHDLDTHNRSIARVGRTGTGYRGTGLSMSVSSQLPSLPGSTAGSISRLPSLASQSGWGNNRDLLLRRSRNTLN